MSAATRLAEAALPTSVAAMLAWTRAVAAGSPAAPGVRAVLAAVREGETLVDLFGLAPFDEDLLMLLAAAARDPATADALAERGGRRIDVGRALALLGVTEGEALEEAWRRLAPSAPLRRFAFLEPAEGALTLATVLAVDERVAAVLFGGEQVDARVAPLLRPLAAAPLTPAHAEAADAAARALGAARAVLVLGPTASGRRAVAVAAAARVGRVAAELRVDALPQEAGARRQLAAVIAREAAMLGLVLVLRMPAGAGSDFEACVGEIEAPLLLLTEARPAFADTLPAVRLPALARADRATLWRGTIEDGEVAGALAERFALGPSDIAAAAARASDAEALWAETREIAAAPLAGLAERRVPQRGWESLVLPPVQFASLRALADAIRRRASVFDDGGFAARHPHGRGVAALFAGPSGTGKTLAAEVIARDLGLDLFRVDLSRVVSKYIGETEKNLGAVFDAAEQGGGILLFDEADALFGKRSEVKDAHDRYANIEVSYLLQRMEEASGLAVLATNHKNNLDPAFLRRLRHVIDFPMPDAGERRALWARAFPPETRTEALDFDRLARLDLAGGDIAVVALNAAFAAAAEDAPVAMRHVEAAARAEYRKLDKEVRLWDR